MEWEMDFCVDYVLTLLQNQNTSENIISYDNRNFWQTLVQLELWGDNDCFSISALMPETLEEMFSIEARLI